MYWVGLSGGVDSAVAALLLKQTGVKIRTFYMKNWEDDETESGCHDKEDIMAAALAADVLGLDFDIINFAKDYRQKVFDPFLQTLLKGQTPNPDIDCNEHIKFFKFMEAALADGADGIATGHYARIAQMNGQWWLKKGEDPIKDQSYFLYRLGQQQLAKAVFPIGGLYKSKVRQIARDAGLPNWSKKDSVGICFIGKRKFVPFIQQYIPPSPGDIQDLNEKCVGTHQGLAFYTIGQRRGLAIGGEGESWFVIDKDIKNNILKVAQGDDHPALLSSSVVLTDLHWVSGKPASNHLVYTLRLRHRHDPAGCVLVDSEPTTVKAIFAEPQRAITPGQHAVLYDGNICLGGGQVTQK